MPCVTSEVAWHTTTVCVEIGLNIHCPQPLCIKGNLWFPDVGCVLYTISQKGGQFLAKNKESLYTCNWLFQHCQHIQLGLQICGQCRQVSGSLPLSLQKPSPLSITHKLLLCNRGDMQAPDVSLFLQRLCTVPNWPKEQRWSAFWERVHVKQVYFPRVSCVTVLDHSTWRQFWRRLYSQGWGSLKKMQDLVMV